MRRALRLLALVVAITGLVLVPASVGNARQSGAVPVGVEDFQFDSFSADYYLSRGADGRSVLKTVETFVAVFPATDQNHGLRRAIPAKYQGAPTDVSVQSVTDGNGTARQYSVATDDNGFVVVTSREDGFVHGSQTYVFTYTQRNVTRYFADTGVDEFYWDTNGTGWYQQFGTVSARIHLPGDLAGSVTAGASCYFGPAGATDRCAITRSTDASGTVFSVAVAAIQPGANVTVAVPFGAHTFVPRDESYFASPFAALQLLGVLGGVAALVWAIVLRRTKLADGRGRPTVIAEYSPPDGLDVATAAVLLRKTPRAAAAEFVDLAVKRRLRIVETERNGLFSSSIAYVLELVDATGLRGAALKFTRALFGSRLAPGTKYLMAAKDAVLSAQVRAIIQAETSAAGRDGLRKKGAAAAAVLPVALTLVSGVGTVVSGFILLEASIGGVLPFALFLPQIILAAIVFRLLARVPLTAAGAELRDHLKGLELYIRLAEADRLRMLQSPTGAERTVVSPSDPRRVVDVFEKLLPYAVLFNLERQWAAELGKYYTDSSPDWYSGTGAFNAAVFASSISSMTTTAATAYSGSASSSSSGGSGGGGSSGGGGGGGGGGGV